MTKKYTEAEMQSNELKRIENEENRIENEAERIANEIERIAKEEIRNEFYEGFNDRLDTVDSQLAHIENNFLTISVKDYENIASNDTEMFNLAFANTNCEIIVPSGVYLIDDELVMNTNTKLVFQGGAKLNFTNDNAKLCVNRNCILKDINIELPQLYNNSAIEISNRTIANIGTTKVDIFIDGVYIKAPKSYEVMNNYEGCIFEICATQEYSLNGFWNIHIQNVTFQGMIKYFCKQYHHKDNWVTSCSFRNITINTCKYGWFGSKNEETILENIYRDIHALVIDNVHFQWDVSSHVCYFTEGRKFLKNMCIWDWQGSTSKYCLSENYALNGTQKITIDSFLTDITEEFTVNNVPDEVSSYHTRRLVQLGGNEYLGNREAQYRTEYSSHYREFGLLANETVPIWFNAKMLIPGEGSVVKGILSIFSDRQHDIFINMLYAGGWYYMYNCYSEFIEDFELYGKVSNGSYGKTLDLYIKFNKNLGASCFYKTLSKTKYFDEIILKRVSEPDTSNLVKFVSETRGAYLNELPNSYIPYLSTNGDKNHIAQKNNRVVYKTKNDIQETIPKFRMGTITTNGGAVNVTFNDLGITNYNVFVNAPIDFSISNKTSTGFTLTSASSSKNVSWLVIG